MDDTKEEIATDSSSAGSSSSNVVSNNSVIIDNGDSNVSIQINDNTTEGGLPLTNSSLDDWKYPNASVTSSSGNSMNLESSDNADAITNWYKGKISSLGMNVNSFVTTTTNNEVKNKLVGATNGKEVSIEISQPTANSKVSIKVSI